MMQNKPTPLPLLAFFAICTSVHAEPAHAVVDAATLTGKVMCGYFSWHHLSKRNGRDAPIDAIPRLRSEFFQAQIDAYHAAGAAMLYVAIFDEVDEGTAIFKCTNDPPVGTPFSTYEGLTSDHYLKLTGHAAAKFAR